MCQLNLVFVKNSKNKKILKDNEYNYIGENFKSFSPYAKGFCNCGSFVGSMSEYTGNSYLEMIEKLNNSELERLNKIKDFMNKPDYKKQKEKYITNREKLSNALDKCLEPMSNYEMEQINLLETQYKGKALEKQMELLYKDLDKKSEEILDDELFEDLNEDIEFIDVPEESFVIDIVIQKLENRYQNDYNVF